MACLTEDVYIVSYKRHSQYREVLSTKQEINGSLRADDEDFGPMSTYILAMGSQCPDEDIITDIEPRNQEVASENVVTNQTTR